MWNPSRLAGPVFEFELLTTSRRGRYYGVRSAYALVLLVILWQMFLVWEAEYGRELTPQQATRFGLFTFGALGLGQELLVLALTPALVAGVIASEKQSKTLHYVLTSTLGGFEVVVGKVLARLLHVAVFVGVGLPVMSLLVLFGGVDPRLVLLTGATTIACTFFLAALSVLVSVYARRVREALFLAYSLEALWLVGPEILRHAVPAQWGGVLDWIEPALALWEESSPLALARQVVLSGGASVVLSTDLSRMLGLQAGMGLLFLLIAGWRLRPVFRAQDGAPRGALFRGLTARGRRRWLGRPRLRSAPLLWKELYTNRKTRLVRIVSAAVLLTIGAPLLYWTGNLWYEAAQEQAEYGSSLAMDWYSHQQRYVFLYYLQMVLPWLFLCGLFGVAGTAAASVTSEHEDDTWLSLTATDLSAREIVGSKFLGALAVGLKFYLAMIVLTASGVGTGTLHPLSLAFVTVESVTFGAFAAAFGVWVSLHLKSTWRAQFLTISGLLLLGFVGQTALNASTQYAPMVWPGFMPVHISQAVLPWDYPARWMAEHVSVSRTTWAVDRVDHGPYWSTVLSALSVAVYGAGAVAFGVLGPRVCEKVAGRPRRGRRPEPLPVPEIDAGQVLRPA